MKNKVKVPVWYWIVSILALICNLIGAMAYLGQGNFIGKYPSLGNGGLCVCRMGRGLGLHSFTLT